MNQSHRFPFQKMHVYQAAKEFAKAVHLAKIRDSELRDQATRAAKSAFLQLSEGLPNDSVPMRRKYFRLRAGQNANNVSIMSERRRGRRPGARNSVCEVVAAIDLAVELGAVDIELADHIAQLAVRALLIGLLR